MSDKRTMLPFIRSTRRKLLRFRHWVWLCVGLTCTCFAIFAAGPASDMLLPLPVFKGVSQLLPLKLKVNYHNRSQRKDSRSLGLAPLDKPLKFSWVELIEGQEPRKRLAESGIVYSVDHARVLRCMKGRHVVVMGDSITRASFMNVAHWLHTGSWYSDPSAPPPEELRKWPDFLSYVTNTTNVFTRSDGSSIMFCDCFRGYHRGHIENRYYRDYKNDISFSFQQLLGSRNPPSEGHTPQYLAAHPSCIESSHPSPTDPLRCYSTQQVGCLPGFCNSTDKTIFWKKQQFPIETLQVPTMLFGGNGSVHTIMMNTGSWGCIDEFDELSYTALAEQLIAAGKAEFAQGVQRIYWRGTTFPRLCAQEWGMFPLLRAAGWRTVDLYNATKGITEWYDSNHFDASYHRGLNEMMLEDLIDDCDDDDDE